MAARAAAGPLGGAAGPQVGKEKSAQPQSGTIGGNDNEVNKLVSEMPIILFYSQAF